MHSTTTHVSVSSAPRRNEDLDHRVLLLELALVADAFWGGRCAFAALVLIPALSGSLFNQERTSHALSHVAATSPAAYANNPCRQSSAACFNCSGFPRSRQ
jgi:hypothetical protein